MGALLAGANTAAPAVDPGKILLGGSALAIQTLLVAVFLLQRKRHRTLEASLADTRERLGLAAEAAELGVWNWQIQGSSKGFSRRCQRICGLGATSLSGAGRQVTCPQMDGDHCPLLASALDRVTPDNPHFEVEELHGEADGKPRWIVSRGRGYFDPRGHLLRLVGISLDVTERKHVMRALQEQREQLAHAGRVSVMGHLASSLAHELNQPLGAIQRNTEAAELFLKNPAPDLDELRAIIRDIREDNQRAEAVIENMRGLLKRHDLQLKPLPVCRLAQDVINLVHADALARRVALLTEISPDLPDVAGDRVHLQQVLLNLVMNAMDALNSGGGPRRAVRIGARLLNANTVEISVSDTGPGIPEASLPRLFEPFYTTKPTGMGMGLPISRTIVEAHGGQLTAANLPGGGARLTLTLRTAA